MKIIHGQNYNTKSEKDSLCNQNGQSSMEISKEIMTPTKYLDRNQTVENMSIPSDSSSGNFENDNEFAEQIFEHSCSSRKYMKQNSLSMQHLNDPKSKFKIKVPISASKKNHLEIIGST